MYQSINPATGEAVEKYSTAEPRGIERALGRAEAGFAAWRETSFAERADALVAMADQLEKEAPSIATLMAVEMGKPVVEGEAEAKKCASACRYFAERSESFLAPVPKESDGSEAFVRCDPLGPILAIMPWNFPFWQFFRFAAPSLMAGNVVLLKHAPNTPGCAVRIERIAKSAGLPEGVVQNLFLTNEQAAEVLADRRVRGVTLTGSTRAGRSVAAIAGRHLKKMVMELGGSDPYIVLEDADLEEAAKVGVASRCANCGQSCIAAKRFLVHAKVFDPFRDALVAGMKARVMGNPTDRKVDLGPMARKDLREGLSRQVEESVAAGAEVLCGGKAPVGDGFFYPPTVLAAVPTGAPAATEELFGPVATIASFENEDEAVAMANATAYGLGASLWTTSPERARRLVPRIDAGAVFVNGLVKSDPRLPFGGVKDSGFGRELAREGILEFVNLKTTWFR